MDTPPNPASGRPMVPGSDRRAEPSAKTSRRLGDVGDVGVKLDVSDKTVRRLNDAGKIPGAMRIGRLVRFDLAVVDDWISHGCPPLHRFTGRNS